MYSINLFTADGNSYPVGGCRIGEVPHSAKGGYEHPALFVITPCGDTEYHIMEHGSATRTPPSYLVELRDRINAALADPEVHILDLRDESASSVGKVA